MKSENGGLTFCGHPKVSVSKISHTSGFCGQSAGFTGNRCVLTRYYLWTGPGLDAGRGVGHLVLDRVAQQFRGGDDAGRDEGEQQRVFDRGNAALVGPEPRENLF